MKNCAACVPTLNQRIFVATAENERMSGGEVSGTMESFKGKGKKSLALFHANCLNWGLESAGYSSGGIAGHCLNPGDRSTTQQAISPKGEKRVTHHISFCLGFGTASPFYMGDAEGKRAGTSNTQSIGPNTGYSGVAHIPATSRPILPRRSWLFNR